MIMKTLKGGVAAVALVLAGTALAEPVDDTLILNGETEMITRTAAPEHLSGVFDEVVSGWHYREAETRSMQADDFENPGLLAVEQGEVAWNTVDGSEDKSCASCHEGPESMRGVRAVMPKINEDGQMWSVEQYINKCRTERMGAEEWKWSGSDMVNMTGLISVQSRGMPISVAIDGDAAPFWEQGKEIYYTRYGQLELACANCHEDNNGNYIRADHLSQGQINGFPTYRLKQASLVSMHNRFKGCIRDTRAVPFAEGSPEFVALELYVASRGMGLSVEGPAIRN